MIREIKFRGRKNSTKEWIYGSLLTDDDGGYAIVQIRHNPISNGVVSGWCFGIEKGTECQYTGLKDKNEKEIYEGDIVNGGMFNGVYCYGKIIFDGGHFYAVSILPFTEGTSTDFNFFEVIGNIYENTELINH